MSNSIWHKADEAPRHRFQCVYYHRNGKDYYFGEYEPTFRTFLGKVVLQQLEVWKFAFAEDIIACLDELERTRKALDKGMEHIAGLNNMIESWYKLLQSDKDTSTKYAILKSAISAYVENKGGSNE